MKAPVDFMDKSRWKYVSTTPKVITDAVRQLANRLVPGVEPVYIKVVPGTDCGKGLCYLNAEIASEDIPGSSIVHGWSLWELPRVYLNAEHHAVVRSEDGRYIDVTPPLADETSILFVPAGFDTDMQARLRRSDSKGVPVEFAALTDSPIIAKFINGKKRLDALYRANKAQSLDFLRLEEQNTRLLAQFLDNMDGRRADDQRRKKNKTQRQNKRKNRKK